jgi:hypothetical protein
LARAITSFLVVLEPPQAASATVTRPVANVAAAGWKRELPITAHNIRAGISPRFAAEASQSLT